MKRGKFKEIEFNEKKNQKTKKKRKINLTRIAN